jgi:hypothetical protein
MQSMHAVDPVAAWYWPAAQSPQAVGLPVVASNLPMAHGVQAFPAFAAEN